VVSDTFNVLTYASSSGSFSSLNLPALTGGKEWTEIFGATQTTLKVTPIPPILTAASSAGNPAIGWPTNSDAGFVLQSATNLAPPVVWQNVTNNVQVIGDQNIVTIPLTNSPAFFRLQE
jgi:hypothetical protein